MLDDPAPAGESQCFISIETTGTEVCAAAALLHGLSFNLALLTSFLLKLCWLQMNDRNHGQVLSHSLVSNLLAIILFQLILV